MIELFSEKTPEETLAQLRSQGTSPRKLKRDIRLMEKLFLKGDLSKLANFELTSVQSSEGQHYELVEFAVTSRYIRNGDTYLAGEVFVVNVSKFLREAREAMKLWSGK